MSLVDEFRYLVGGYYGIMLMDEYSLKEYVLKDVETYIKEYFKENPIDSFNYEEEANLVLDTVSDKTKLQDALLVLNRIKGPIDLILLIKLRLKNDYN